MFEDDQDLPVYSAQDYELDAFQILQDAPDYDTGVNQLVEKYKSSKFDDQAAANKVLSDYGNDLRYRFKQPPPDIETLLDIAPIKPYEVEGEGRVEQIDAWEKQNLDFLSSTNDPDYLAVNGLLSSSISNFASEARRDELGERGEGLWAWTADKAYRVAGGAVGPFAKLLGADDLDQYLIERTQRSRDEGVAGKIAYSLGAIGPLAAVSALAPQVGIPAALGQVGVIGAQAAGEARSMYEESMEATGDATKATRSAMLVGGAQVISMAPLGRGVNRLIGGFGKEVVEEGAERTISGVIVDGLNAQKRTFGNVAVNTVEAGLANAGGQVLGNAAQNIGTDSEIPLTHGAADAFIAGAILGGGLSGAHALVENAAIEQAKSTFKNLDTKLQEYRTKAAEEGTAQPDAGEPLFVKDKDGHWIPKDQPPETPEERAAAYEAYEKAYQDYVDEAPVDWDGKFTTPQGEEVTLPVYQDYEVASRPEKTVLVSPKEALRPGRFMTYMAGKLGGKLELGKNIANGAFGAFYPNKNVIRVLRSLGADPDHFLRTTAHEIGHFIDGYMNDAFTETPELNSVAEKLLGFKKFVDSFQGDNALDAAAKRVSMKWRPGWDGEAGNPSSADGRERFRAYRSAPVEVYADVVSALLNDPAWVRENENLLYRSFEAGLSRSPELNSFWSQLQEFENNPASISEFNLQIAKSSRQKQGVVESAIRTNKVKNDHPYQVARRDLDLAYQYWFDKIIPARQIVRQLEGVAREEGFDLLNDISASGMLGPWLGFNMEIPMKKIQAKFLQTEIDPNIWAQYEWLNRVNNEESIAMRNIRQNPDIYREAAQHIGSFLINHKGVKQQMVGELFTPETLSTPEGIIHALSQVNLIGDTAQVLEFSDFLNRYSSGDRKRVIKAQRDYNLAISALNRRKVSIPIENLRAHIEKLPLGKGRKGRVTPELKEALKEVTKDSAFAVRSLLVNAGGYTKFDAGRDLAHIQQKLGPEKFKMLQDVSKEFHEVISKPFDIIKKSGIFTPEAIERMVHNKDNYVTANVLKYFEGDDKIAGSIRTAIGSLSETGNELASTYLKTKAIAARAHKQTGVNAAIDLAGLSGQIVDTIPFQENLDIFVERDRLSKSDKDHSYLIGYKEGVPKLYKIAGGKGFENMFKNVAGAPVLDFFLNRVDALNKVFSTRQFKTVFSPAFVLSQKFYDRALEAAFANSFEIKLGLPIHTSKHLRQIDAATREALHHYNKTGELTGPLKEAVDLNVLALDLATLHEEGIDPRNSASDAFYEMFGTPMPKENAALEAIGLYTQKAIDKLPGFKYLADVASFDEMRTKINGFQIAKSLGMTDAQAAVFAREKFGIPDPLGGGVARPLINRMFLFGAAHFGGLRILGTLMRDMPKTAATQAVYRVLLPKLLTAGALGSLAVRYALGDDAGDKFDLLLKMVPTNEKISRGVMLLGAQDGQGNFHNFIDLVSNPKIKLADIQTDFKAWYMRFPQSRELTAITKVMWPLITELSKGEFQRGFTGAAEGAFSTFAGSVQPFLQYGYNLTELLKGKNPTDFFRMKGILDKNVAEAGSFGDKLYDYGKYVGSQQFSAFIPYNPFQSQDPKNKGETLLHSVPLAGPLARSMIGISNYGLIEDTKEGVLNKQRRDAEIKLSTDDATKTLLENYSASAGQMRALGEGWQAKVGEDVAARNRFLTSWHSRTWLRFREELEAAESAGDSEWYAHILSELEKTNRATLKELSKFGSKLPDKEGRK